MRTHHEVTITVSSGAVDSNDDRAELVRPWLEAIAEDWNSDNLQQCLADFIADCGHLLDRLPEDEVDEFYGNNLEDLCDSAVACYHEEVEIEEAALLAEIELEDES